MHDLLLFKPARIQTVDGRWPSIPANKNTYIGICDRGRPTAVCPGEQTIFIRREVLHPMTTSGRVSWRARRIRSAAAYRGKQAVSIRT
jgi:hypothetical protein